jgi:hypothetical protein
MATYLRVILLCIATVALALFAIWELGMDYPVAGWLYLSVAVAFGMALIRIAPVRTQRVRLAALLAVCAVVAALRFVDWTSRKPFLRDLARVRVGMTESQVKQIMSRYIEGTGMPRSPVEASTNVHGTLTDAATGAQYSTGLSASGEMTIENALVFRHSHDARFNADWGIVRLSKGRVVGVEFSPD